MSGPTVGIYGLGLVGMAIARRLLQAGVVPFGFRRGSKEEFVAAGGSACASALELVERCDAILLCTPPSALQTLVDARFASDAARTTCLVDVGVAPIEPKRALAKTLAARGVHLLDAPIQGNPPLIDQGKSVFYVSGDRGAYDAVRETLLQIGAAAPFIGEFGAGSKLKFAANMLMAMHSTAAAEAVAFCQRSGIDARLLLDVCPQIVQSGVLQIRGRSMIDRSYANVPGSLHGMLDVIETIVDDANGMGMELPMLRSTQKIFERAVALGLADVDSPCVVESYDPPARA